MAASHRTMRLLLLLLAASAALAQEVRLVAGPGCLADQAPSPPTNLKAEPLDGGVRLSWNKPSNGACVTEYQVTVVALNTTQRSAPLNQKTADFTVTISGLTNGQPYRFFVKAFSARFNGGGEAAVEATPAAACDPALLPSQPTILTATAGNALLKICWGPPTVSNGCVDEYRLAIRALQQNSQRAYNPIYRRVNSGACTTVDQLVNNVTYEVAVQAWSASMRGGGYATVRATPVAPLKPWSCLPAPGSYPLCAVAAAGRCPPLTCRQQAAAGQCFAPFMRVVDPSSRTIVQYCSDVCGCAADPAAKEPAVRAFDNGVSAGNAALASQADAATRAAAAATATVSPATKAAASYQTDSSCCASPPRPARRDFGFGAPDGMPFDAAQGLDDVVDYSP